MTSLVGEKQFARAMPRPAFPEWRDRADSLVALRRAGNGPLWPSRDDGPLTAVKFGSTRAPDHSRQWVDNARSAFRRGFAMRSKLTILILVAAVGAEALAEVVDRSLRELAASREILWIYDRWFVRPLPSGGKLDLPMSVELRRSLELIGLPPD
jgi:hypothetical protein